MYMKERNEKKQLAIFSMIAFGLPVIMGLFMWYGYSNNKNLDLFSMAHMYYPAAGAMIALLLSNSNHKLIPKPFFICYLLQTAMMIGISLFSLFSNSEALPQLSGLLMIVGGLLLWLCLLIAKKDRRAAYGLSRKNWKATIWMVALYVILYTARMVVAYAAEGNFSGMLEIFTKSAVWIALLSTLVSYIPLFVPYFGEEYGWRYFFQPILQKRYGSLKGVLILGVLWGLWHLPLNFFFYTSPADGLISVTNQVVVCLTLGIFYAYAYMKTDNIWTVVAMHFLNNNLVPIFSGDLTGESAKGYSITWSMVGMMAILMTICYAWPALTKFFKDRGNLNPTPEHRADTVAYNLENENEQKTATLNQSPAK
ncbi:CPBP family intramembrane glutamic endopeptidase [Enterococcus malodoratus]|uniref:CAAX prenyl protease 2/Lysostaphin resistance protein A-like domain-containing protein n=1 Tax=Enterococcus malodoratus ATCC 43197 TaxID=1158601 RepID=R2QUL9_9ENTE|nr:type II CAAX endopeptidase family protein [Enterococcus malodoratus]EOH75205.1 hypothetical protein UAI_03007 [Enterococcus malodoratus ATCC 43197]EOT66667.1 hypothetical protein I585_02188 [Enterococcus malodoratus ATCC 43197]OJG66041.1 hypothetical protein RV07_GL001628 [Enterococcus malodoratus]SPW90689.1 CAAX amino terminal protease self- immunity [Enterococcus malodoratus]STD70080.1 CAAX amino terminal protease self- immunity [Enterococcus malodoratus]